MASNSFGKYFKITTWGESHGPAIGVVIDGCPPGLELSENDINEELSKRSPGKLPYTSPRKEEDKVKILSGTFEGKTTGTPISILIENKSKDSSPYEKIKDIYRPSHANFTYLKKYGIFDYRGNGRASARETATRVAGGAIAKKLLKKHNIEVLAYISSIGNIETNLDKKISFEKLKTIKNNSSIYCPDKIAEKEMLSLLKNIKEKQDSIGGCVKLTTSFLPVGLGNPVYEKLSANMAKAMLTIPGAIAFEIGSGFNATKMKGSQNNDPFILNNNKIETATNNCGGILGGISTGMPLNMKIGFKPTPTIGLPQKTLNIKNEERILNLPPNSKHDTCIAIRATSIVEAMAAIVLVNYL